MAALQDQLDPEAQWRRSTIPSNSLASVYGLLASCAKEQALGFLLDAPGRGTITRLYLIVRGILTCM